MIVYCLWGFLLGTNCSPKDNIRDNPLKTRMRDLYRMARSGVPDGSGDASSTTAVCDTGKSTHRHQLWLWEVIHIPLQIGIAFLLSALGVGNFWRSG